MNIPTFINQKWIEENGYLTSPVEMYNDELNQTMQNGLSDNGWTLPQLTTVQITKISTSMPNGTLWYDKTTDQIKALIAGVVTVIS